MIDRAMLHPYFLTVFWDLTCHPCQQSPGDLLANGATVRVPCDEKKLRPFSPPLPHPTLCSHSPSFPPSVTPLSITILFLLCIHLITSSQFLFLLLLLRFFSSPFQWTMVSFSVLCPFSSALIYGGSGAAGVESYDVWLQVVILISSHMAKLLLPLAKLSLSFLHSFPCLFLFNHTKVWLFRWQFTSLIQAEISW